MSDFQRYLPVLQSGRWFAQLPPEFSNALLALAKLRTLQPGEALFLRDGAPCGLYVLVNGCLRISGQSGNRDAAREALLVLLTPPQWFGEISVFDGSARTHHAHAVDACTLLQVPHVDLLVWLQTHPRYWRDLATLMADKLRMAFVNMEEQAVLPAPQRLARRLLGMAQGYGQRHADGRTQRVLAMTQEELALMVGVSRQTTNQILKQLEAQGALRVQRGGLELLNTGILRALCD
jgi:CRP/FNR family transcriptional regulator, cyclic AMP receptor protein